MPQCHWWHSATVCCVAVLLVLHVGFERCASVLYFDLTCVGGKKRPVPWRRRHCRGVFQCKLGFLEVGMMRY